MFAVFMLAVVGTAQSALAQAGKYAGLELRVVAVESPGIVGLPLEVKAVLTNKGKQAVEFPVPSGDFLRLEFEISKDGAKWEQLGVLGTPTGIPPGPFILKPGQAYERGARFFSNQTEAGERLVLAGPGRVWVRLSCEIEPDSVRLVSTAVIEVRPADLALFEALSQNAVVFVATDGYGDAGAADLEQALAKHPKAPQAPMYREVLLRYHKGQAISQNRPKLQEPDRFDAAALARHLDAMVTQALLQLEGPSIHARRALGIVAEMSKHLATPLPPDHVKRLSAAGTALLERTKEPDGRAEIQGHLKVLAEPRPRGR